MRNCQGKAKKTVICFGEVLWDSLQDGMFFGGAPLNVGYHLKNLGLEPLVVSSVGDDVLADEVFRRLGQIGINTKFLRRHPKLPTSRVLATISPQGDAKYDILKNVAWDDIEVNQKLLKEAKSASAVIFGTLSQRTKSNLKHLFKLLTAAKDAWKIYDVNLRPPFYSKELVFKIAHYADVVKLNNDEANILTGVPRAKGGDFSKNAEICARKLKEKMGCKVVCVTCGAQGAGILYGDEWFFEKAYKVDVEDTVGSGDAWLAEFTNALVTVQLNNPKNALSKSCRRGEWVAQHRGAMPIYR
jgi:fructokinase